MASSTLAERVAAITVRATPRQVGALPLVYPIIEMLLVQETLNTLHLTRADIDLGRLVAVLTLNRLLAPQPPCHIGAWADRTVALTSQINRPALAQAQVLDGKLPARRQCPAPHG